MIFRTSYFVGIMACALAVVSASHVIEPAHAETLRITGPNGEVSSAPTRQYGPTTSSDTFWSIAQKVRPNQDISVYQVMAALFDANPHAFSSNNYNSLERGMTLLVPSADVMAQISRADAKTRAENNDKRLPNANPRTTAATIPATNNPAATNNSPSVQKPLQIVAETQQPTAEELAKQAAEEVQPQIDELTVKLEDEQTKVLSLTDELARSEDMLMVKDADNTALKAKIQELTLQLSAMQEDFQLLTEKHQALEASHQQLIEQNNKPEVVEEPTDFWRSISDNMILLAVLAALPLIVIFLIIFWLMRRKSKAATEPETVTAPVAEQAVTEVQPEVDDIENLAIHLDDDEADADNIDDLLDLDSAATEELSLDDSSDADMYITEDAETTEEEAEGTSLDDLWAEAMEEQEEDLQPLEADEDDLDSLLEGLDTPVEEAVSESVADEDDLDSLLAGLDEPETRSDEAISETEEAIDPQDDIDSLLADFDVPDGDIASEPDAEKAADTDPQDDIDSLLAGFDVPEDDVASEPDAEKIADTDPQDDIDSLLAGFDVPEDDVASEPDAEKAADTDPQDDIDSLLAGFDVPEDDVASEPDAEKAADTDPQDDIDSLLAGFDVSSNDVTSEPDAEKAADTDPQDDIDSLLADFDLPEDDVSGEAPVETEAVTETNANAVADEDDLDALLASIDAPTEEEHDFTAEIAAELEDDVSVSLDETANIDELIAEVDPEKEFAPLSNEGLDVEQVLSAELEEIESELHIESDNDDIDSLLSELESASSENTEVESVAVDESDVDELEAKSSTLEAELAETEADSNADIDDIIADIEAEDSHLSVANEPIASEPIDNESVNKESVNKESINEDSELGSFENTSEPEPELDPEQQLDLSTQSPAIADADLDELLADLDVSNLEQTELQDEISAESSELELDATELKFAPGDESALDIQDDTQAATQAETDEDPLVAELLAAEQQDQLSQQSNDEQDSDIDELDALLADFDVDKIADEEEALFSNDDETISEQDFDTMLADLSTTNESDTTEDKSINATNSALNVEEQPDSELVAKESGFFDDLKSKKTGAPGIDWEADLFQQASNHPAAEQSEAINNDDDSYQLVDDNLTVDEALAALDAQESLKAKGGSEGLVGQTPETSHAAEPSEDMLNTFEQENGFIDIDKLLNDADEDVELSDQYKDVDVDMGEVNALIGNAEMIDVDDEENSVNAKLDLARAYIEIEDEDAAKAILKEVQIDGNERQQTEAGKLLNDMS
ncbi:hypothetical protein L2737_20000 [Shewanella electrodiphila]|uniref:Pilus assembly protein FimV n=1 Tax=Shewanella electrodiphila TaxID=934143 RepID=A0ABT0KUT5_9GAMM|nr:FimV/HubP family polar landmark protein [Shewanella electrodiphila]MCL1047587.1 hypothetical protein [Shewanella electrodiphila]